jgi:hypothetical protein
MRFVFPCCWPVRPAWSLVCVFFVASQALSQATWRQVLPVSNPGRRMDHSMVYDSSRAVTVLFGGFVAGVTWAWPMTHGSGTELLGR